MNTLMIILAILAVAVLVLGFSHAVLVKHIKDMKAEVAKLRSRR